MVQIVKQIVSIDLKRKKGRRVLPGAAQVYVGNGFQNVTETVRLLNIHCTKRLTNAGTGKERPEKSGKARAVTRPLSCQGSSLPVCKGFSSISDAFDRLWFTIGCYTSLGHLGRGEP